MGAHCLCAATRFWKSNGRTDPRTLRHFKQTGIVLIPEYETPGIMDARGLVLNRQEQIKRMVRHLFKAILFVKVDG